MIEGAKKTLEGITGKTVVGTGDSEIGSLGDNDDTIRVSNEVEFAIVFGSGRVFYTGGFEGLNTLDESLARNDDIAGSYSPSVGAWCRHGLNAGKVESIIDLREDTKGE